jgi:hypothetical protein
VETITAKPLEEFPEGKVEGEEDGVAAGDEEFKGVLRHYYGFVSIFASISVVLMAISVWIMLQ